MTALTANIDRTMLGGEAYAPIRLAASQLPFQGSVLILEATGYAKVLTTALKGAPFAGFAESRVITRDLAASPADGDLTVPRRWGIFFAELTITGVAQDDVTHKRAVYASDDNTFGFSPDGTLIGVVSEIVGTNRAQVLCATIGFQGALGLRCAAVKTMAATGNQTLTTSDLGKLILVPNTGALALTLPLAADSTGRGFVIKKTNAAAAAITVTGAGSETIDGANTFASQDANYDTIEIVSDGTSWHLISTKIA